jgi:hypothetical protein
MKLLKLNIVTSFLLICIAGSQLSFAQENPIKSLEVKVNEDRLVIVGHFSGLIDNEMKQTLASGLSSTLSFHLQLFNSRSKVLRKNNEAVYLRYNVWEKVYQVLTTTQEKYFDDIHHFENFLKDSLTFDMGKISKLPIDDKLRIVLSFSPEKISDSQKSKLNTWLVSEGEMNESKPALESESGFSVNLSNLISIFLSKKESQKIFLYKSTPFTIRALSK